MEPPLRTIVELTQTITEWPIIKPGTLNGNDRNHTEVPNNKCTTQIDNSTETHTNDTEVPNNNCTTQIDNSKETHTTDVSSMARRRNRRFVRNKRQNHPNDSVINLSNTELTVPQERLLSRGLNYVPKPPAPNQQHLQQDLKAFYRHLRLREHFADAQTDYNPADE